jgi:hypothetical protein
MSGPGEHDGPPGWGGGAFGPPPGPPARHLYGLTAKGHIRYVPVTHSGGVIGYLWASSAEGAAGFVRRLDAPPVTFRSPLVWSDRLQDAFAVRVPSGEVLCRWAGEPEDPAGGAVAADAREQDAENLAELYEIADTGSEPPPESLDPGLPDGFMDRSKGWGDLSPFTLDKHGYDFRTDSPVRYLPVTKGGNVLGYLWASIVGEAADYLQRNVAGAEGFLAGGLWMARLEQSEREGLPALEALRRWIGAPEDPERGGIVAGAQEREAPSLDALKAIANR